MLKLINRELLHNLTSHARNNPRLRKNFNIHDDYEEPCQRLLNAMEPNSYIRPHRHLAYPKIELFLAIRGLLVLLVFSEEGNVMQRITLSTDGDTIGVEIPPGVWHTVVSLERGSVFFEVKPGPFVPLPSKDRAPWAPEEGTPEAMDYLENLLTFARGEYA